MEWGLLEDQSARCTVEMKRLTVSSTSIEVLRGNLSFNL